MIAAAPPRDSSLSLIRLILTLSANQTQSVPDELKTHLIKIIDEAKRLFANPTGVAGKKNPEAIALALEMKKNQELADSVNQIKTSENISPTLAQKILEKVEVHSAYKN